MSRSAGFASTSGDKPIPQVLRALSDNTQLLPIPPYLSHLYTLANGTLSKLINNFIQKPLSLFPPYSVNILALRCLGIIKTQAESLDISDSLFCIFLISKI